MFVVLLYLMVCWLVMMKHLTIIRRICSENLLYFCCSSIQVNWTYALTCANELLLSFMRMRDRLLCILSRGFPTFFLNLLIHVSSKSCPKFHCPFVPFCFNFEQIFFSLLSKVSFYFLSDSDRSNTSRWPKGW